MDDILTLDEVAKHLKASKRTIQREVAKGVLQGFRVGRALRFTREQVQVYMDKKMAVQGEKRAE